MSFAKFKQVLVYVGLSFSFLFASIGVSNAEATSCDPLDPFCFEVTAEVCDPADPDQNTPGSFTGVSVGAGSSLDLGLVTASDTVSINFDITASNPLNCLAQAMWVNYDIMPSFNLFRVHL